MYEFNISKREVSYFRFRLDYYTTEQLDKINEEIKSLVNGTAVIEVVGHIDTGSRRVEYTCWNVSPAFLPTFATIIIKVTYLKELVTMKTAQEIRKIQGDLIPESVIFDIEKTLVTAAKISTNRYCNYFIDLNLPYIEKLTAFLLIHNFSVKSFPLISGGYLQIGW